MDGDMLEKVPHDENDPFSPNNLRISQFILTARLYDVMFALLKEANPEVARSLLELHANGAIVGPQPSFNGTFITDVVNAEDEYSVPEG